MRRLTAVLAGIASAVCNGPGCEGATAGALLYLAKADDASVRKKAAMWDKFTHALRREGAIKRALGDTATSTTETRYGRRAKKIGQKERAH